jgi:hypothetical protein
MRAAHVAGSSDPPENRSSRLPVICGTRLVQGLDRLDDRRTSQHRGFSRRTYVDINVPKYTLGCQLALPKGLGPNDIHFQGHVTLNEPRPGPAAVPFSNQRHEVSMDRGKEPTSNIVP